MISEHEHTRIFRGPGYAVKAHPKSCFFCQHLTDIFYDSAGPYGFICDLNETIETGMRGMCRELMEADDEP